MSRLENRPADRDFRLVVEAGHPAAEVMLVNSNMQLVDRAIGTLDTRQPGGIYQLKTQMGRNVEERTILLDQDAHEAMPLPDIASPVPLPGTSQTHPSHTRAARAQSRTIHYEQGEGAALFVFVGRWSSGLSRPTRTHDFVHPGLGLTIRQPNGRIVADLARHAALDPAWDGWAALTVSVDPGVYYLRHKTRKGPVVEQPLVAVDGWQTQVFLVREHTDGPQEDVIRDSELLSNVAILMSQDGFDPGKGDHLLTEAARLALADDRPFMAPGRLDRMSDWLQDPLLGIFTAHLILRAEERWKERLKLRKPTSPGMSATSFDPREYANIVGTLADQLGVDHPDVMALSLKLPDPANRPTGPIRVPPMLRQSWSLIVEASNERDDVVDRRVWERISELTESRPFLSWNVPPAKRATKEDQLVSAIKTHLDPVEQTDVAAAEFTGMASFAPGAARTVMPTSVGSAPLAPEDVRRQISEEMGIPRFAVDEAIQKGFES